MNHAASILPARSDPPLFTNSKIVSLFIFSVPSVVPRSGAVAVLQKSRLIPNQVVTFAFARESGVSPRHCCIECCPETVAGHHAGHVGQYPGKPTGSGIIRPE